MNLTQIISPIIKSYIFLSLLFLSSLFADTTFVAGGTISGQTWSKANSPYGIQGDILVASLTIESGVEIVFMGDFVFEVAGILTAVGTEQDSIHFTKADTSAGWQGIYFNFSSPGSELAYCIIENSINSGIRINNSSPIIRNCRIAYNSGDRGAGIIAEGISEFNLQDCLVDSNIVTDGQSRGGGIYVIADQIRISNCIISNNIINGTRSSYGGGIFANGFLEVEKSVISSNSLIPGTCNRSLTCQGGGIFVDGKLIITNSIVMDNIAYAKVSWCGVNFSGSSYGGGIYTNNWFKISNCIIKNNISDAERASKISGGGISGNVVGDSSLIFNSTVAYNINEGSNFTGDTVSIKNSIFWENIGTEITGSAIVSYSDIQDGFNGKGNINVNPIFESSENLQIVFPSLCTDAGDSSLVYNDPEDPDNPGFALSPSLGTVRNDMGAHGGPGAIGWTEISLPTIDLFTADPVSGQAPLNVFFEITASDEDGSIVDYYWDFNGDGQNDDTTTTGINNYIYTENGTYNAKCRVTDDQGGLSAPATIQINVYPSTTRVVSVPDDSAAADATFILPIRINDMVGIAGAEFRVSYDPSVLEATNASTTNLSSGFALADSVSDGNIAISMAQVTGLASGSGNFVNIIFHVASSVQIGETSQLILEHVALYDADTNPIESSTEDGLFTVSQSGGGAGSLAQIFINPGLDTLARNQTQLFSAYGIDDEQNQLAIDVNWSYGHLFNSPGEIGSSSGQSTVFSATGYGDGYIVATYVFESDTLVDTAYVIVGDLKGDINVDNLVNVPDAILCLQIAASIIKTSLYQSWAADFNNNGDVNSGDALGILNQALGNLFPKVTFTNNSLVSQSGPALLFTQQNLKQSADLLQIPVYVAKRTDLCGLDLIIDYNELDYDLIDISAANPQSYSAKNLGLSKISVINPEGLQNDHGQILFLYFRPKHQNVDNLRLSFLSLNIFDNSGNEIDSQVEINRSDNNLHPQKFVLYQNYPNPFNPSTKIQYDVAEKGKVVMQIYSVTGQLVRTLVSGNMNVGTYTVTWYGDDNAGQPVASGIYFCRINYSDGSWLDIKKMLFVK